jgi:hypothetical protein
VVEAAGWDVACMRALFLVNCMCMLASHQRHPDRAVPQLEQALGSDTDACQRAAVEQLCWHCCGLCPPCPRQGHQAGVLASCCLNAEVARLPASDQCDPLCMGSRNASSTVAPLAFASTHLMAQATSGSRISCGGASHIKLLRTRKLCHREDVSEDDGCLNWHAGS